MFGAKSSPSVANFALKQSAIDQRGKFDDYIIDTVTRNFYVDDCLTSTDTEEEAARLINGVTTLLKQRGFKTKWASNKTTVLNDVAHEDRAVDVMSVNLDGEQAVLRTLGITWDATADTFMFNVLPSTAKVTRRGILSDTSSLFDPLGLVAPVLLPAKQILQEMCQQSLSWDDSPSSETAVKWINWRRGLMKLQSVRFDGTQLICLLLFSASIFMFSVTQVKLATACAYLE